MLHPCRTMKPSQVCLGGRSLPPSPRRQRVCRPAGDGAAVASKADGESGGVSMLSFTGERGRNNSKGDMGWNCRPAARRIQDDGSDGTVRSGPRGLLGAPSHSGSGVLNPTGMGGSACHGCG